MITRKHIRVPMTRWHRRYGCGWEEAGGALSHRIYRAGQARNSVLFCPQDAAKTSGISGADFGYTSYAYSMSFYHSSQQIDNLLCPAQHNEQWDPSFLVKSIPQRISNVAVPSGKILVGEWDSNHIQIEQSPDWWHRGWCWDGGRNFCLRMGMSGFFWLRV